MDSHVVARKNRRSASATVIPGQNKTVKEQAKTCTLEMMCTL